jgi:hypothetical protein
MNLKLNYLLTFVTMITFICFPQKKVFLFDNLHAETAGNADWVIDEDNLVPARYPTPAQSTVTSSTVETYWTGALSSWGIALVKLGDSVETLTATATLTYGTSNVQDLKNYDVFIIDEPNIKFSTAEKTALINFVQNGGGLFMISDHTGSDRNNDGWDSPMIWNDLFTNNGIITNPFGMSVDLVDISQTTTNVLADDYLTAGTAGTVTAMKWSDGSTTTLNPAANSTVTGVVWTTGTAHGNTNLMVSRAKYGTGRVVLVCDSSPADDGTGGSGNTLYVGWLDPSVNGSHAALHLNASLWLAKILEPDPLPVELKSFTAFTSGNNVNLKWITATEINNSGFSVERSFDNNNFIGVGFITGKGTSTKTSSYSFSDNNLAPGSYAYRLKQVDFDGKLNYSNVVNVNITAPAVFYLGQNYPNPFNPSTSIKYSIPRDGLVSLAVYNILGEKVSTLVNQNMSAGNYEVKFDASHYASGIYFYRLDAGVYSSMKKMILMK